MYNLSSFSTDWKCYSKHDSETTDEMLNAKTNIDFSHGISCSYTRHSYFVVNAPGTAKRIISQYPHKAEDIWRKTIMNGRVDVVSRILQVKNVNNFDLPLVPFAASHHQREILQLLVAEYQTSPVPVLNPATPFNGSIFLFNDTFAITSLSKWT